MCFSRKVIYTPQITFIIKIMITWVVEIIYYMYAFMPLYICLFINIDFDDIVVAIIHFIYIMASTTVNNIKMENLFICPHISNSLYPFVQQCILFFYIVNKIIMCFL